MLSKYSRFLLRLVFSNLFVSPSISPSWLIIGSSATTTYVAPSLQYCECLHHLLISKEALLQSDKNPTKVNMVYSITVMQNDSHA